MISKNKHQHSTTCSIMFLSQTQGMLPHMALQLLLVGQLGIKANMCKCDRQYSHLWTRCLWSQLSSGDMEHTTSPGHQEQKGMCVSTQLTISTVQ